MAVFFIAKYTVTNPEGFAKYGASVRPTFAGHDAEFVVVDSNPEVVEGSPATNTVVIKFPSKEAFRGWYDSPAYQAIKHHRIDNTQGDAVLVEGFAPPA